MVKKRTDLQELIEKEEAQEEAEKTISSVSMRGGLFDDNSYAATDDDVSFDAKSVGSFWDDEGHENRNWNDVAVDFSTGYGRFIQMLSMIC